MLQLVSESLDDYEIMFADTGLEFPETIENVKQVVEHYGKKNSGHQVQETLFGIQ